MQCPSFPISISRKQDRKSLRDLGVKIIVWMDVTLSLGGLPSLDYHLSEAFALCTFYFTRISCRALECKDYITVVILGAAQPQKNPRAHKNKIGTSPPPQNPPLKRRILWTWVFLQKERIFPGVHKIGAAISGPRIADTNFTDTRIFLTTPRNPENFKDWAAANGGVTNGGLKGWSGRPSWKSTEIGLFRPFSCLFRPFPEGLKSTWKIQKTEEKGPFPQISSDFLKPPSLKPPFAALQRDTRKRQKKVTFGVFPKVTPK